MSQTLSFKNRETIFAQGAPAALAYRLVSGNVRIFIERNEKIVDLAQLEPGAIFGEAALFGGETYMAHAEAAGEAVLEPITPASFEEKLAACDPMIRAILLMFRERLLRTNDALVRSETREFMDIVLI